MFKKPKNKDEIIKGISASISAHFSEMPKPRNVIKTLILYNSRSTVINHYISSAYKETSEYKNKIR
jgi:hypothetical protein